MAGAHLERSVAVNDKVVELAAAVIRQAIRDASRPDSPESASARRFLAGSDGFRWWCEVAGLDPESVIERLAAA